MRNRETFRRWLQAGLALAAFGLFATTAATQTQRETIGRIEGENVAVTGQVALVRDSGLNATVLVSGSEVHVRSGQARIYLEGGGEIDVCGPAKFTLLKSGGSLTLAFQQGRVRTRLGAVPPLVIYSASVSATPLPAGDAPRDAVLGLDADGAFCALPVRGAVRLEYQLTGQSVVVPQSSEVLLPGGQLEALRASEGNCQCEVSFPNEPPSPARPQTTAVRLPGTAQESQPAKDVEAEKETPPAKELPVWKVEMPPLTFNASEAALPDSRPEFILLVRQVRIQSAVVFTGRVVPKENYPRRAAVKAPPVTPPAREESRSVGSAPLPMDSNSSAADAESRTTERRSEGVGTKIKNFFRRIFGRKV
jgi:hypothetical protein